MDCSFSEREAGSFLVLHYGFMMRMLGEQFDYRDEICGAVINVRGREKVSVWTKNASNEIAKKIPQSIYPSEPLKHHIAAQKYYRDLDEIATFQPPFKWPSQTIMPRCNIKQVLSTIGRDESGTKVERSTRKKANWGKSIN
ncbi:hypothetical protein QQ045_031917 [Rhodiola kirilowii]